MTLRERLLGTPEGMPVALWSRRAVVASEAWVTRAARATVDPAAAEPLAALLDDPRAAVRRAAADALGRLGERRVLSRIEDAFARERTLEGRLALAVAATRIGGAAAAWRAALAAVDGRQVRTEAGMRAPGQLLDHPPLTARFDVATSDAPALPSDVDDPAARAAVVAVAAARRPEDYARLRAFGASAGRRGAHALLLAAGLHGDPRWAPDLEAALRAMDVDPGRGFTQRRLAALSLGRVGLRTSVPALLRALAVERRDYEGRPGAGMGIQYPVRAEILVALGEIGDPRVVPTLRAHLRETTGSAVGGLHIPALDALDRLGAP